MTRARTTAACIDSAKAEHDTRLRADASTIDWDSLNRLPAYRQAIKEAARRDWAEHGMEDGTVDPVKAGWDQDPNKWRVHYRVRSVRRVGFPMAEQARAEMGEERWAELNQEWEQ